MVRASPIRVYGNTLVEYICTETNMWQVGVHLYSNPSFGWISSCPTNEDDDDDDDVRDDNNVRRHDICHECINWTYLDCPGTGWRIHFKLQE